MADKKEINLSELTEMRDPGGVFEEVKCNFIHFYSVIEFKAVRVAYEDFRDLFAGRYPGYKACNTRYHDALHTTDALLAMSRLIDGYNIERKRLPVGIVKTALIATIFHDAGYIQSASDRTGTGAKYTLTHVNRSIEFLSRYLKQKGFPGSMAPLAGRMVSCTGLGTDVKTVDFEGAAEKALGYMLGTADLLGQMSSRSYLERLLYLYREFKEGNVKGYQSEFMLMQKTLEFHRISMERIEKTLGGVYRYAGAHFRERYHVSENLYLVAIERQMAYWKRILGTSGTSLKQKLRCAL